MEGVAFRLKKIWLLRLKHILWDGCVEIKGTFFYYIEKSPFYSNFRVFYVLIAVYFIPSFLVVIDGYSQNRNGEKVNFPTSPRIYRKALT